MNETNKQCAYQLLMYLDKGSKITISNSKIPRVLNLYPYEAIKSILTTFVHYKFVLESFSTNEASTYYLTKRGNQLINKLNR
ncbi:Uncharacterised protein [Listeria fleischmannii subsp. fleischmannii]|uniref:ArnR1-like winged helix-turn-helix domain-containing protein n=1 Tax=Listeria fleischmannii subsp. fleischmannii TaxID=1671902 RepID=A0A2X3J6N3_9LIST|nr:hypothetical protein LFLEISCH_08739 [Listeria fleischmannii subsp. fleischmannii LU2006-1]SQC69820.1 Uncharacterised protein [Listeria fleischmannii subsp. fleischmannii]